MSRKPSPINLICLLLMAILMLPVVNVEAGHTDQPAIKCISAPVEDCVENMLRSMTLEEKIGQMFMIGIQGTDVDEESLFMLHQYHIGGIILFDRNMKTQEQVKQLNAHLQAQAGEKLPLFIAVDEEGGVVARMKEQLPPPPSAQEIGETGAPDNARLWARKTARALRNIGFNVNLAPVADIGTGRGRSFGNTPVVVTDFVRSAASGYEQEDFIYCLKHFPGLGRGKVDTHLDSTVVNASRRELMKWDVMPFQSCIREKNPSDYFIMVNHATYSKLERNVPASISKVIQTDFLRRDLGYQGVIITDDIAMGALSKYYAPPDIALRAVRAGADIILSCHVYQNGADAYLRLLRAVEKGEIREERINESLRRILRVKLTHLGKTT
ncbi:glycoside hydrolase family 3 protein [Selenomonas ruminantium]|uniref:glycoside hydrolase family 3 protein n=1 Tax=Selenomonas ruminantium TaxID=971 RepID=UPI00056A0E30|nr:glycoside hydrolase family 3 protein [Selenomonas ruminantium]